jgi:hypothetical protein
MLAKISSVLIVSSLALMTQALPVPSLNLNTTAFIISGEYLIANTTKGNFIDAVTWKSQNFSGSSNFSIMVDVLNNNVWGQVTVKGKYLNKTVISQTVVVHTNFTNKSYSIYSGSSPKACSVKNGNFSSPYDTVGQVIADFNLGANSNFLSNDGSYAIPWIGAGTYQEVSFGEQAGDGIIFLNSTNSIVALAIAPSNAYFGLGTAYQAGLVYDISVPSSKKTITFPVCKV